jgi:ATP-dependent Clp protease ATP-binding subunit ClpC
MVTVFERFTDAARRVVVGAQAEAYALNHDYIGTEHILLGVLRDDAGAGFRLLGLFEVPIDEVRQRVEEIIGRGGGSPPAGHIPFTPRAKKVLEMSLREALQLGDNFIGSEHVLLGLLREGQGVGAQVLAERGVTLTALRDRLEDVERDPGPEPRPGDPPPGAGEDDDPGEEMIHVPGEHFARLVAEVARLRELLRHHGIDPDEQLPPEPGLGDDRDPPVA